MYRNAYDSYLESRILSADPIELVQILYRAAIEAIGNARRFLQENDIPSRSREISRAQAIVMELALSLNHDKGGDLSRSLASLYDYVQNCLTTANFQQCEAPLNEAARLLTTLLEGWEGMRPQPDVESEPEPLPVLAQQAESATPYSRAWGY